MAYGRYGTSHFVLRIGLASSLVWIATALWLRFSVASPFLNTGLLSDERGRVAIAGGCAVAALLLALNRWSRLTAAVATMYLISVLLREGRQASSIGIVALTWIALALLFWPHRRKHKHWWQKIWPRKRKEEFDFEG